MLLKLSAVEDFLMCCRVLNLFKVLYSDTNFLPKLTKCCHEVLFDNCFKSWVALQETVREAMAFFLRLVPFRTTSHDFWRNGGFQIISLAAKFDQLVSCAG